MVLAVSVDGLRPDAWEQAETPTLDRLATELNVPDAQCHITLGSTGSEIRRVAEEQGVDLIVVGSHGRHGLALLLGSTANAVLHGAPCDVLAVRVKDEDKDD